MVSTSIQDPCVFSLEYQITLVVRCLVLRGILTVPFSPPVTPGPFLRHPTTDSTFSEGPPPLQTRFGVWGRDSLLDKGPEGPDSRD